MDKYGMNGHGISSAQYETPFADIITEQFTKEQDVLSASGFEVESPFLRTYEALPSSLALQPQGEEFVDFLAELNDTTLPLNLYELADEAENNWAGRMAHEVVAGSNHIPLAMRYGREYFEPLALEAEAMIDTVSDHFTGNTDYSEREIEDFFDQLTISGAGFSPAQEDFLGSVFKKVKSVVKKGVALAKKGISAVGKILPLNVVLKKIKGLVRPLLNKVLKFAIGKLPKNLQPHAQTLAKKFLNLEAAFVNEDAGNDPLAAMQTELDTQIAQLMFAPDENEAEHLVADYETSFETLERNEQYETGMQDVPSLDEARHILIRDLKTLQEGESAAPAIERFLPAAIVALQPVIKIAISLIGRQKVINFLAGLLARLVEKYIPAAVARPLAASIIDVGMSAIGFEVQEKNNADPAYEAIANTIEDTIQNMNELNEAVIEDQETLAMHMMESFEKAAASNFPAQFIRPDLRLTRKNGLWVQMPRGGSKSLYKKFTHVFDVTIDPRTANAVSIFRGLPLANFLRDKYGLDTSRPIQAKAHLYEASGATRLSHISRHEKLPGLSSGQPYAWIQLLPLTSKAATLLLKEPALGKEMDAKTLSARHKIQAGQRFYFLEINGARFRIPQVKKEGIKRKDGLAPALARPGRSGDIQAVVNFVKSEIILNYYFSEEDAKNLTEKLNRNDFLTAAQTMRHAVKGVLNEIIRSHVSSKVKIVHEAFPELFLENYDDNIEGFSLTDVVAKATGKSVIKTIIQKLVDRIAELAYQALGSYFKTKAAEFRAAQAEPADGVTVMISWRNVQGMSVIRTVINAVKGDLSITGLSDLKLPSLAAPEIRVIAGKKFE